jgi:hypothetical protein
MTVNYARLKREEGQNEDPGESVGIDGPPPTVGDLDATTDTVMDTATEDLDTATGDLDTAAEDLDAAVEDLDTAAGDLDTGADSAGDFAETRPEEDYSGDSEQGDDQSDKEGV